MARDLVTVFGAFILASALAGALGAANLGTALAFGQIAFAASDRVRDAQTLSARRGAPETGSPRDQGAPGGRSRRIAHNY